MSLISNRLASFRSNEFKRQESIEEKEIKKLFPEIDEIDIICIATEYRMWKNIVISDKDLTFQDFIDDLNQKTFERKPVVTDDLKQKALKSLMTKVIIPKLF